jgi:hypothetical protein
MVDVFTKGKRQPVQSIRVNTVRSTPLRAPDAFVKIPESDFLLFVTISTPEEEYDADDR